MFYLSHTVGASCPPVKRKEKKKVLSFLPCSVCVVKDLEHEQKRVEPEILGKVGHFGRELGRDGMRPRVPLGGYGGAGFAVRVG